MNANKRCLKIGLTGGFGTGKSTVARMLADLGAQVTDADDLARALLRPGTPQHREVLNLFGPSILSPRGEIDRRRLAGEVFGHPRRLEQLNRILHPPVMKAMEEKLARWREGILVMAVPLLYEVGTEKLFDYVVVVRAAPEVVKRRNSLSRKMTGDEIEKRRDAQLPLARKEERADFIIDNNGTVAETRRQVEEFWKKL